MKMNMQLRTDLAVENAEMFQGTDTLCGVHIEEKESETEGYNACGY